MIINNTANDYKRRNPMIFDDLSVINEINLKDFQPNLETKQFASYVSLHLIKKLNTKERLVFKYHFIDGMKYEETAEKTGIKLANVKTIIFVIRKKANRMFENQYKSFVA